jgi:DNA polymerase-3 subunit delta
LAKAKATATEQPSIKYTELFRMAQKGDLFGCYILYGEDDYMKRVFVSIMIDMLVPEAERTFALEQYNMRETPVQEAVMAAESVPFTTERKVVVLDNALFFTAIDKRGTTGGEEEEGDSGSNAETETPQDSASEGGGTATAKRGRNMWTHVEHNQDELLRYMLAPAPFTVMLIIVSEESLDERRKLVTAARKAKPDERSVVLVDFSPKTEQELHQFLQAQAEKRHIRFAAGAMEQFLHVNGKDLRLLRSELDKLALNVEAGGVITSELIERFGIRTVEEDVFTMIDATVNKKVGLAHEMLLAILKDPKDGNPFMILNLIARQLRLMLAVKELERRGTAAGQMASALGIAPFVVNKTLQLARRADVHKLADFLSECADLEVSFKSTPLDPKIAIELLVLKLAT